MRIALFLSERIAEDEAKAHDAAEASARSANGEYGGQSGYDDRMVWVGYNRLGTSPRRVLDECRAKRRIIEDVRPFRVMVGHADWFGGAQRIYSDVLHILAQPYADHPDFRPEWRA